MSQLKNLPHFKSIEEYSGAAGASSILAALRAYRSHQNEKRLRAGDFWDDIGIVFPSRPLDYNDLYYRDYKKRLQSAGLKACMTEPLYPPSCIYEIASMQNRL